jgi:myo-inositol 2-dehydrogenase / D-chiro-inositol 1-dehydrogenase
MQKKRIAIAGAGHMARVRGRALLDTGRAEICAIASRGLASARACGDELGCDQCYDDVHRLAEVQADAILVEVPHQAQDDIVCWALRRGLDVFIGGCLACDEKTGREIIDLATRGGRVVEVGYQRRYDPAWEAIRAIVESGELGKPILAVTMALWRPDPSSWYCSQQESGGMPLTHMSYCYLNAMRWLLGQPMTVAALAYRSKGVVADAVAEQSCAALIGFDGGAMLSATASYCGPPGLQDAASRFVFEGGGILVGGTAPDGHEAITLFPEQGPPEVRTFATTPSAFVYQADAFLDAMDERSLARNSPQDALIDLQVAAAISTSARGGGTIQLHPSSHLHPS